MASGSFSQSKKTPTKVDLKVTTPKLKTILRPPHFHLFPTEHKPKTVHYMKINFSNLLFFTPIFFTFEYLSWLAFFKLRDLPGNPREKSRTKSWTIGVNMDIHLGGNQFNDLRWLLRKYTKGDRSCKKKGHANFCTIVPLTSQ